MSQDVFISYSSKDREIAEAVCKGLEDKGIGCWIAPRNILPGKEWGEQIIQGIETSKLLVLIFSSYSNESAQVLREVERAVSKGQIIINFRIEDILPTKSMEYFLYSNHWLDAFEGDLETYIEQLGKTVRAILAAPQNQGTSGKGNLPMEIGFRRHSFSKGQKYLALGIGGAILVAVVAVAINLNSIRMRLGEVSQGGQLMPVMSTGGGEEENISSPLPTITVVPTLTTSSPPEEEVTNNTAVDHSKETIDIPSDNNGPNNTNTNNGGDVNSGGATTDQDTSKETTTQKADDQQKVSVKVGQIMTFGRYNGEMINWQVIDIDDKGNPLLLTQDIISLKPFDGAESGTYNDNGAGTTFDKTLSKDKAKTTYSMQDMRMMKGSNRWANSNLREWLNSSEKAVSYHTKLPTGEAVSNPYGTTNSYEKEPGFLCYFSEGEKARITSESHRSIISDMDKGSKDGGSSPYDFAKASVGAALGNASSAYYEQTSDKVFLLSIQEVNQYMVDRGWNIETGVTSAAVAKDKSNWYNDLKGQYGGNHMWWLRTPDGNGGSEVCVIAPKGDNVYTEYATMPGVGVRPAIRIDLSGANLQGQGTADSPFTIQ